MNPSAATRLLADLGVLYELSLAIGTSLDFDTCCDGFLKPLMARKGLTLAAIWEPVGDGAHLVHANPASAVVAGRLPAAVYATLRPPEHGHRALPAAARAGVLPHPERIAAAITFDLGRGVLLLAAADPRPLAGIAAEQLRALVHKFGVALDGCRAHAQLGAATARAELLALVARSTDSGVIVSDRSGGVVWVNHGFERLTGYRLAEVRGRRPGAVLQGPDTDPAAVARIRDGLARRVSFTEEILNYHRDGTPYWVSLAISPIDATDSGGDGFIAIQRDVTDERRRREELERARQQLERQAEQLARARERAERSSAEKTRFLAQTSHELRTPLTAIIGYAELLERREAAPDQARDWLRRIRSSADQLIDLIGDVLDLSSIEQGRLEVRSEAVDVRQVLHDIAESLGPRATARGLAVRLDVDPAVPTTVRTDRRCFRQIVQNLATNAVKYTATGTVRIGARAGTGLLCIDIEDTGPGIPADQIATIFEPFVRAPGTETRSTEGSGLGLAIARRLADAIQAHLDVSSRVGVGTTFTLCLPSVAAEPRATIAERPVDASLAGRRILIAEDTEEIVEILTLFLEPTGVEIHHAPDGRAAVDLALASRADHAFDLILMDLQMPVLDGISATRELRAAGWTAPIVALTASVLRDDVDAVAIAGCDDHVAKPITEAELLAVVQRWLAVDRDARSSHGGG